MPTHIVRPARFRREDFLLSSPAIKIIDFGEAFLNDSTSKTLHTTLSVRAPEIKFGDPIDHRVDLWSAGCLLFELVTGQPPFDSIMVTPPIVVQQMLDFATDGLPCRWQQKWNEMQKDLLPNDESYTLQEWLEEIYFDSKRCPEFTREDLSKLSLLIGRLLRLEPASRATAREILADEWFNEG